jgi:hypothetical protein
MQRVRNTGIERQRLVWRRAAVIAALLLGGALALLLRGGETNPDLCAGAKFRTAAPRALRWRAC